MVVENKSRQVIANNVKSVKAKGLNFHGSLKSLLVSQNESMEDKIATVKTAQLVDSGRFEAAFKTLMKR